MAPRLALAPAALALCAWGAVLFARDGLEAKEWTPVVIAVVWIAAAALATVWRPREWTGPIALVGSLIGTAALLSTAVVAGQADAGRDVAEAIRPLAVALLPAAALHLLLALPDGALPRNRGHITVALGYIFGAGVGIACWTARPSLPVWPVALEAVAVVAIGSLATGRGYGRATGIDRQRMQWVGLGIAIAVEIAIVAVAFHALLGWPPHPVTIIALATLPVPVGVALGSSTRIAGSVGSPLTHAISLAGLTGVVGGVYFLIVLGLGRAPDDDERSLLLLSMLAAAVAALLYPRARERLTEVANGLVYGEMRAPDEALRAFGSRLSRAVPLDELLLQLAESLRKNLSLVGAEVWTGTDGRLERTVSDPDRGQAKLSLSDSDVSVVARAGPSGNAWVAIWLPDLLAGREQAQVRVVPIAHSGELLGLIVVERAGHDEPFEDEHERVLSELSRQVGLALHNAKLDSALQTSLDELREQADELRASRTRIVAAADAERRKIERDLHDGAQQYFVALAVKLRLAADLGESDPAKVTPMLEEARESLQEGIQVLRDLAHGIYPPLLMDNGLADALSAAAARAALPTVVEAEGIGRYPQDVESAIYFCCLEALQNASKYAGEGARAIVRLREQEGGLTFQVSDDGKGFEVEERGLGAGFTNMIDRIGAIGGSVRVESQPGSGTTLSGIVPLSP